MSCAHESVNAFRDHPIGVLIIIIVFCVWWWRLINGLWK